MFTKSGHFVSVDFRKISGKIKVKGNDSSINYVIKNRLDGRYLKALLFIADLLIVFYM